MFENIYKVILKLLIEIYITYKKLNYTYSIWINFIGGKILDKANIIISIIIVLCIAAAVAAYGITNSDSPIFSDLSSMSASNDAGDGLGNNTTQGNGSGVSVVNDVSSSGSGSSGSSSGGSSSGGSSSGSSSSGPSSSGSSSSSSGSSSSGSGSNSGSGGSSVSSSTIKSDAWSHIGEEGAYPGTPYYSGSYWYVTIYNANGTAVDSLQYSSSGAYLGRG